MNRIHVYTKEIIEKEYDAGLANAVHFELIVNGSVHELNCGYGMLFPAAEITSDNTIAPRGAANPRIFEADGRFIIVCDYIDESGTNMAPDKWYTWESADFITFKDCGLIEKYSPKLSGCDISLEDSLLADAHYEVVIGEELIPGILKRWEAPYGISAGTQRTFKYPLVKGFADPVVFTWNNKWYFLATNDINGNIGIFMRQADSLDELFLENHKLSVILDYDEKNEFIQTFWAPEWHIIGGIPYILFAVGGKKWAPQSHMMKYKGSGDIMDPNSWEKPVRIRKKDNTFLCEDGITLDMTYLPTPRANYVIWSERYNIGTPLDSGSMLYIATVDEHNPYVLTSDKVLLSRPLFGWENVAGTINNEGPYCLVRNGRVIVSYSGGDACGHYYAVGSLTANIEDDLLNTDNWSKSNTPFFNAYTLPGIDGPGHSSFFVDEMGNEMIAFHGQDNGRQSGIHQFFLAEDGRPVLIAKS